MVKTGLYIFSNDLRLDDNPALRLAASEMDQLICCYIHDDTPSSEVRQGGVDRSDHRNQFLHESLVALDSNLQNYGHRLVFRKQSLTDAAAELIRLNNVSDIYGSFNAGRHLSRQWNELRKEHPTVSFQQRHSHTIFKPEDLPFTVDSLPFTFSKFRRQVEDLLVDFPAPKPKALPPPPENLSKEKSVPSLRDVTPSSYFTGGENIGWAHVNEYFNKGLASTYKATRNGLDGMDYSTKFSPWLANGCVSVKSVIARLKLYERHVEQNESTYWIYFELLWREYFQWYAYRHKDRLFDFSGISLIKPQTSFYAERYQKWCHGNTPYPIINALMKQLNSTGFMSNRGRQLIASCFVHELSLDWRYGAAYLEQHLIDYDEASNWGNWQYLAGVGADPKGHRKFDLHKQTEIYDPDGEFIKRWAGNQADSELDSVDATDWPV